MEEVLIFPNASQETVLLICFTHSIQMQKEHSPQANTSSMMYPILYVCMYTSFFNQFRIHIPIF